MKVHSIVTKRLKNISVNILYYSCLIKDSFLNKHFKICSTDYTESYLRSFFTR